MRFSLATARGLVHNGQYREALHHYLIVLAQVKKEEIDQYAKEFGECIVLYGHSDRTSAANLRNLISPITALFPQNRYVYTLFGLQLIDQGLKTEAYRLLDTYLKRTVNKDEACPIRIIINNLCSTLFDSWHMIMLNNKTRNSLYAEAIARIPKGKLVLEIGSGTGLLSILAHKQDLDVIAVEENGELVTISRKNFQQNYTNNGKRLQVVHCNSKSLDMMKVAGRKADVLITEIFDCCAFGEGIIETYRDAHKHLVNPGCIFIPGAFQLYVTLVQSEKLHHIHAFEEFRNEYITQHKRLPCDPYWCDSLSNYPDLVRLSEPTKLIEVNLALPELLEFYTQKSAFKLPVQVTKKGTLHAIIVHWTASLAPGIELHSNMEDSCWDYGIFPVRDPRPVIKKQKINLHCLIGKDGKRLNVCLSDELMYPHSPYRLAISQYLNICHEPGFSKMVEKDLDKDDNLIFIPTPFNWRSIPALKNYEEKAITGEVPLKMEIGSTILRKRGCRKNPNNWEPPFDRVIVWPFMPDGGLNSEALTEFIPRQIHMWIEACRLMGKPYKTPKITPSAIICKAHLVYSDYLDQRCRLQPDAHLGINLKAPNHPMHLFECRDIYLHNFEHTVMSVTFNGFEIDLHAVFDRHDEFADAVATTVGEMECAADGEIDGILYWWDVCGFETKNLPCCSFVFPERMKVTKGQKLPIRCDLHNGYILMTIEQ